MPGMTRIKVRSNLFFMMGIPPPKIQNLPGWVCWSPYKDCPGRISLAASPVGARSAAAVYAFE